MTVVEKAAYLKGLAEGLGVDPESKDGKLWGALCDLVSDMAHEIEELQQTDLDFADTLDAMADELSYVEDLTCDLDMPEDFSDDEDYDFSPCGGCNTCESETCAYAPGFDEDEELSYDPDAVFYDIKCPACGEETTIDEQALSHGGIICPACGAELEFDLDEEDNESGEEK